VSVHVVNVHRLVSYIRCWKQGRFAKTTTNINTRATRRRPNQRPREQDYRCKTRPGPEFATLQWPTSGAVRERETVLINRQVYRRSRKMYTYVYFLWRY